MNINIFCFTYVMSVHYLVKYIICRKSYFSRDTGIRGLMRGYIIGVIYLLA